MRCADKSLSDEKYGTVTSLGRTNCYLDFHLRVRIQIATDRNKFIIAVQPPSTSNPKFSTK